MPIIKRYGNRKLYESETRRYVTLEDIAEMVRNGENVKVVDYQTGDDLTAATLMQVIFEQERRIGGILPEVMLTRVIRAGGAKIDGLRDAVRAFVSPDEHITRGIQQRLDRLVGFGVLTAEESIRIENLLLDPRLENEPKIPLEDMADPEQVQALFDEVQRLEKVLEDLEKGN